MAVFPKFQKKNTFLIKTCSCCGMQCGPENFAPTRSLFYPEGVIPFCNSCMDRLINENDGNWEFVDKICQMMDIPFVPREWEKLREMAPANILYRYAQIFQGEEYVGLGWKDYYDAYRKLKDQNQLENELPEISTARKRQLQQRWGANYDVEALEYLEGLYNGLLTTQNVNGALQVDQALKLCKMSYEIDCRIREGAEFDKILASYDKLVKSAEFTPKNVKNINDFDTFGEAAKWLEKNGWKNKFYDGVTRDIVDESIKNFQLFNQRLYTNETNIGDEIHRRLESLQNTAKMENIYDTDQQYDLDAFEREAMVNDEDFGITDETNEFSAEVE